jgi:hypothetical protein
MKVLRQQKNWLKLAILLPLDSFIFRDEKSTHEIYVFDLIITEK